MYRSLLTVIIITLLESSLLYNLVTELQNLSRYNLFVDVFISKRKYVISKELIDVYKRQVQQLIH